MRAVFGEERVKQSDAEQARRTAKPAPKPVDAKLDAEAEDGEDDMKREDSVERAAREREEQLTAEQNQMARFSLGELDISTDEIDFEGVDGIRFRPRARGACGPLSCAFVCRPFGSVSARPVSS
jgi:hypothetical protein